MAREVAIDVASHSPQVDPILDELIEVLADLNPMTPEIPYYSATLFDPREQPAFDAGYWADNLRHTVRFAAAVQAALEDGYRVFARAGAASAAHPRRRADRQQPRHAAGRAGRHAARAGAALRAARLRRRPAQCGRRGRLLRAVPGWAAGGCAAADLDAPSAAVEPRRSGIASRTAPAPLPCIRLLGAHVRLHGGTGAPRLAGRGRHRGAALAGRPPDPQRGRASRGGVLRDGVGRRAHRARRGVRGPRHPLRADAAARRRDRRSAPSASVGGARRRSTSRWRPIRTANDRGRASAVLHARWTASSLPHTTWPRCSPSIRPAWTAPSCARRSTSVGIQYGPAFTGLAAVHTARRRRDHRAGRGRRCPARSARSRRPTACTRRCWMRASSRSRLIPTSRPQARAVCCCRWACVRLRCYRPDPQRPLLLDPGDGMPATPDVEADLDVLDQHGTVLLTVEGLRLGAGRLESSDARSSARRAAADHRMASSANCPSVANADAGAWLLISTSRRGRSAGGRADRCAESRGRAMHDGVLAARAPSIWSTPDSCATTSAAAPSPVWSMLPRRETATPTDRRTLAGRGSEYVPASSCASPANWPETPGEPPRLYVVTRNAPDGADRRPGQPGAGRTARPDAGDRRRASAPARHPDRRGRRATTAEQVAQQLLSGSEEDETAWRNGQWYTARLRPAPLRPEERQTTVVDHERDGHAPADPHPR